MISPNKHWAVKYTFNVLNEYIFINLLNRLAVHAAAAGNGPDNGR